MSVSSSLSTPPLGGFRKAAIRRPFRRLQLSAKHLDHSNHYRVTQITDAARRRPELATAAAAWYALQALSGGRPPDGYATPDAVFISTCAQPAIGARDTTAPLRLEPTIAMLIAKGLIAEAVQPVGAGSVIAALIEQIGPVLVGGPWRAGFNEVDAQGFIAHNGRTLGYHCVMFSGASPDGARLVNSWGVGWGMGGRATIGLASLTRWLSESQAVVLVGK